MNKATFAYGHMKAGTVTLMGPGTAFGARLSAKEAFRLLTEVGDELPFTIMAAGYGDDEGWDWVGLNAEDLDDVDDVAAFESMDWAPFEVSVEGDWSAWTSDKSHALLTETRTLQRTRTGRDILIAHLGHETTDAILEEMRANDLDFTYVTCESCKRDLDEHTWHFTSTHTFG